MSAYIYVMRDVNGPAKIGFSKSPVARRSQVSSDASATITIPFAAMVDGNHRVLERMAHEILRDKRVAGEWFDVTDEAAVDAVRKAADVLGYSLVPHDHVTGHSAKSSNHVDEDDGPMTHMRVRVPQRVRDAFLRLAAENMRSAGKEVLTAMNFYLEREGLID